MENLDNTLRIVSAKIDEMERMPSSHTNENYVEEQSSQQELIETLKDLIVDELKLDRIYYKIVADTPTRSMKFSPIMILTDDVTFIIGVAGDEDTPKISVLAEKRNDRSMEVKCNITAKFWCNVSTSAITRAARDLCTEILHKSLYFSTARDRQ